MKSHPLAPVAFLVPMIFCSSLSAQTDQPFALQVSGVAQDADQNFIGRELGVEGQIRWTRGAWSFGAGVQFTSNGDATSNMGGAFDYDANTLGLFLEPKFVVLVFADRFGLYVSSRVAVSRMTESEVGTRQGPPTGAPEAYSAEGTRTGFAAHLGLGLLIRLTPRVNVDLGGYWGVIQWGETDGALQTSSSPFFLYNETYGAWVGLVVGIG